MAKISAEKKAALLEIYEEEVVASLGSAFGEAKAALLWSEFREKALADYWAGMEPLFLAALAKKEAKKAAEAAAAGGGLTEDRLKAAEAALGPAQEKFIADYMQLTASGVSEPEIFDRLKAMAA